MASYRKKTDWSGLLTLMLLPVVAIGLIFVSSRSTYKLSDMPRPRPSRLPPPKSMLLDRSAPVSRDLGIGNITDQQMTRLVSRMEALTDAKPAAELPLLDIKPAETTPTPAPQTPTELTAPAFRFTFAFRRPHGAPVLPPGVATGLTAPPHSGRRVRTAAAAAPACRRG